MPNPPEPTVAKGGVMKKMSLTEAERKLIEAHRQRTASDRAFNAGLDHAIECIPTVFPDFGPDKTSWTVEETERQLEVIRADILAAFRDV